MQNVSFKTRRMIQDREDDWHNSSYICHTEHKQEQNEREKGEEENEFLTVIIVHSSQYR